MLVFSVVSPTPAASAPAAPQKPEEERVPGNLTASGLITQGRAAFEAQDFTKAEKLLDQLVADYGENAEVAPLVEECLPLLAMCKVKRGAFEETSALIAKSLQNPKLPAPAREELSFWQGICLLRTGKTAEAQEQFGAYFADTAHDRTRRYEAFLLFGTGYIQLEDYPAAADFFAEQIPKLPPDQKEVAGRARVLLLHSLMEAGRGDGALALVRASFPELDGMTQVVSFQLLTLRLGAKFLEEEKWYEAITCLNRLWPRGRLLEHQRARQAEWRARRELLKKEGAKREALVFQTDGILTRISRELAQFEKIESYDAARELRLAQAFMGLGRWREAASILETAVSTLEPDKILKQAARAELESWRQIAGWDKVLAAADRWQSRFAAGGKDPERPAVLLARAEALHGLNRTEEAERQYGALAHGFPENPLAARAFFMGGICQMELDRPEAAVITFRKMADLFPETPLLEDALYWEGMALTFQKNWAGARELLASWGKKYPDGKYAGDAAFERARCLHNQLLHEAAAAEFKTFRQNFPDNSHSAEAGLLLGESLMASGEMEPGLKVLAEVPESEDRLFEEAQFKIGEGLRKLGKPREERDHFARFIASRPRSLRLAEAVLYQGRAAARLGQGDEARALYWSTLEKLGEDPANEGVEDLLLATRRLYPGADGIKELLFKLDGLQRAARAAGRKTLAVRALWARGNLLRESSPAGARVAFVQLGDLLDPAVHHPRLLADCADARRESGAPRTARDLYLALRKWHPRAVEKERSSYGLGMLSLAEGKKDEAMVWFEKCGQETAGGTCGGEALLERAVLLRGEGKTADAADLLRKVTGGRMSTSAQKARALLELGRCALAANQPERALGHFERCCLSGAHYRAIAAEAWLQRGQILESLHKPEAAAEVLRQMLAKRELASQPPAAEARQRLKTLTGSQP
ncbi:MAG: tetratricopeptide repeat protein [Verrucomicrobiota bacterium]